MAFGRAWWAGILGWAGLVLTLSAQHPAPWPVPGHATDAPARFRRGDDPTWARPEFDDRGWEARSPSAMPSHDGIYWLRLRVNLPARADGRNADAMAIAVVASYDVYWDGRLIGRSGVVGAEPEREVPGPIYNQFRIPDALAGPGPHLLALRMSSWHTGFREPTYGVLLGFGDLDTYARIRGATAGRALVVVGAACVVAIVFGLFWWLGDRRPAFLLFSAVCLAGAAVQAGNTWRLLWGYPYDWHYPAKWIATVLIGVMGVLLVAFLQELFQAGRRWAGRAAVVAAMLVAWWAVPNYSMNGVLLYVCGLAAALAYAAWGVRRGRRGAVPILAGLLVNAAAGWRGPDDLLEFGWFLLSFGAPLVGCVAALMLRISDERRRAREAQLTAARMEIELLRKNLQPHFLLNTLTAVAEVIEQDPPGAVRLIDDLATEFRSLAQMSGERLVPLQRELELCRAHLKVISRRTGREIALQAEDLPGDEPVPPALFLTLIENGLAHQQPAAGAVFRLAARQDAPGVTAFEFLSPGPIRPAAARPAGGTGLRYVKARLEESFPGAWELAHGAVAGGWQTVVSWRAAAPGGAR